MRIRLTRSGLNVAGEIRGRGEEVDVERDVAQYLTSSGQAVLVRDVQIEQAVEGPAEGASRRTRRRRGSHDH